MKSGVSKKASHYVFR